MHVQNLKVIIQNHDKRAGNDPFHFIHLPACFSIDSNDSLCATFSRTNKSTQFLFRQNNHMKMYSMHTRTESNSQSEISARSRIDLSNEVFIVNQACILN